MVSKPAGSGTDEALDESTERPTPAASTGGDVGSNTSVWRRPTLDGHFQVVPPTMIGVFDPTAQLSKFARQQTSSRKTSPPANFQRRNTGGSGGTASKVVPKTAPKELVRFDGVRQQANRVRDSNDVRDSPPRTLADISQLLELTKTAGFKGNSSPTAEPPNPSASETADVDQATVAEVAEAQADDVGNSSTSSSSSSSSSSSGSEENDAKCDVNVDNDEGTLVRADVRSPVAVKAEHCQTSTSSTSGSTRSSLERSPGADDVTKHQSEHAEATNDNQLAALTSRTTSRKEVGLGGHVDDSPLALLVTSSAVNEDSLEVISDLDVQPLTEVKNETVSSSSTSSSSTTATSSHDEQDADFDQQQPELKISTTDHGIVCAPAQSAPLVRS